MKNKLILISVLLNIILIVGTIGSYKAVRQQRLSWNKEMTQRLDLEEKLSNISRNQAVLEEKFKESEQELAEIKTRREALEKELTQERLVNQSLKNELEKMTNLQEALEEDLKEALLTITNNKNNKSGKVKK